MSAPRRRLALNKCTCLDGCPTADVARSRFPRAPCGRRGHGRRGHGPPGSRFVPSRGAVMLCEARKGCRMPVKGVRRRVRPARQVWGTPALPRRGLSVKDVDDGRCDGLWFWIAAELIGGSWNYCLSSRSGANGPLWLSPRGNTLPRRGLSAPLWRTNGTRFRLSLARLLPGRRIARHPRLFPVLFGEDGAPFCSQSTVGAFRATTPRHGTWPRVACWDKLCYGLC